ncbi:MAG TPA: PAS domain-containing protein [Aliidongia sp.]|uniref:PAS domain-containing protein n=1 Tax=Aliidongia sp. TaxID=1914230 RepID=UPI002DDD84D1|nr:PAS domain-containing protein [Aliidongia sp.]HEV2675758.1 PAS domain-containing protein [Aliidongia sp.]
MLVPSKAPLTGFQAMLSGTPLEDCFAFWQSRRAGRPAPPKSIIDPVAMPQHIIPHLFLYERTGDGRFRCRLAGTAICEAFQHDPTGQYLDDMILPSVRISRIRLFEDVVERVLPIAYSGNVAEAGRTWIKFRRLMMPITIGGSVPDGIFGMVVFPGFELRKSGPKLVDDGMPEMEIWATPDDLASG